MCQGSGLKLRTIGKTMLQLFRKNKIIREIVSTDSLVKFFVYEEKKARNGYNLKCTVQILGLFKFNCWAHERELEFLSNFLPLFENKTLTNNIKELPEIEVSEFPLRQIIALVSSENGTNLSKFIEKIKLSFKDNNITDPYEQAELYIINLQNNRQKYLDYFNHLESPINKWIFSNASYRLENNRFKHIKNFTPFNENFYESFSVKEYCETSSFEELYSYITNNKSVPYKKELERYLWNNILVYHGDMAFINAELFEQLRFLFSLDDINNVKSVKQLEGYINQLKKISLDRQSVFLTKEINFHEDLYNFCNSFKESPLVVLSKCNIPFHIIKDQLEVIKKYEENYKEKLSIAREKKLYYFMNHLSKRLSKDLDNFKLDNNNDGYCSKELKVNINSIEINSIKDYRELYKLGVELNNCAGNLETIKDYKDKFNYVVAFEGKKYIGQIKEGVFLQFKGYKNESPPYELFLEVFNYLHTNNYVKDSNEHEIKDKYKKETDLESLYNKECIHRIYIK